MDNTLDKERLSKLLMQIDRLYNSKGNDEFKAGIVAIANSDNIGHDAIFDEIYEYCLEKNTRAQAKGFYSGFPFTAIRPELEKDFLLMESFRRRGVFDCFAAHLFKQVECIANYIIQDKDYQSAIKTLLPTYSLIQYDPEQPNCIRNRKESEPISKLVFNTYEETQKKELKSEIQPEEWSKKWPIIDRVRAALYFSGYATIMYSDYEFRKKSDAIYGIYLVRCYADHGGYQHSDRDEARLRAYLDNPNLYYASFLETLYFYVMKISEGVSKKKDLLNYATNLPQTNLKGVITSVLPSGMVYLRIENGDPILAPKGTYSRSDSFAKGDNVTVLMKAGVIIKIQKSAT